MVVEEVLTYEDMDVAESRGIPRKTAYERMHRLGWRKEKAISYPIERSTVWQEYKEQALANDVTYTMFNKRRQDGMTPEDAIAMGRVRKKYGIGSV